MQHKQNDKNITQQSKARRSVQLRVLQTKLYKTGEYM
jgi:hypothetical protein